MAIQRGRHAESSDWGPSPGTIGMALSATVYGPRHCALALGCAGSVRSYAVRPASEHRAWSVGGVGSSVFRVAVVALGERCGRLVTGRTCRCGLGLGEWCWEERLERGGVCGVGEDRGADREQ